MNIIHKYSLLLFLCLFQINTFSQLVENVRFEQQGEQIIIFYDLISNGNKGSCSVNAYYTSDYGKTYISLKSVTGDAGRKISAGRKKKIVWNVLDDLYELKGEIKFRVTASSENKYTFWDYDLFLSIRSLNDYLPLGGRIGFLGPNRVGGYVSIIYGINSPQLRDKTIVILGPILKIVKKEKLSLSVCAGAGNYELYDYSYDSIYPPGGFIGEAGFILNLSHFNVTLGLELSDYTYLFAGIGFTL